MVGHFCKWTLAGILCAGLAAQEPSLVDPQGIRQAMATEKDRALPPDTTPKGGEAQTGKTKEDAAGANVSDLAVKIAEARRQNAELLALKSKDGGKRRFAADLFDFREFMSDTTDGGISEDYVLGVGDKLQVLGFGSATFELSSQVDGRGNIVIPKVGILKVAGMTLGKAKASAQKLVSNQLAGTTVDLTVSKLREVRVFVQGEVYRPGSYLVSNLSSLVNILSLAGGPTSLGSFRQIRVVRGGSIVHQVDLYPLRADGLGNMNFAFQTGDTIYVPLAFNQITLEGSFVRVAGPMEEAEPEPAKDVRNMTSLAEAMPERTGQQSVAPRKGGGNVQNSVSPPSALQPQQGAQAQQDDQAQHRDHGRPFNQVPSVMQFELLPGETAKDALHFAGGLLPKAYAWGLTLRRQDSKGITSGQDIPMDHLDSIEIQRGDVLSALPRRDGLERLVKVEGWVRVPGTFARTEGLRVGELLKRDAQVMPDTYLKRGDIVRTLADGSTQYLAFNVANALSGMLEDNVLLSDRDQIRLYTMERMRLQEEVTFSGPFTKAGAYPFHKGMRVADLVFLAGIPNKEANRMNAELARTVGGRTSEILKLDLARLTSTEDSSPVNLLDDTVNPLLHPDDIVSVFQKPDFKVHKTVKIHGQVINPGSYVLTEDHPTLSSLIARAGGPTSDAMVVAGMLFRPIVPGGESLTDIRTTDSSGISEILDRLNETKLIDPGMTAKAGMQGSLPSIFKVPVLHGLDNLKLNRVVVDFPAALAKRVDADIELNDKDEVFIPRKTQTAMILGEAATPFAFFKVEQGMTVRDILRMAGGTTRNADTWNIRLLKADGHIIDHWVTRQKVEPGDAVLVPQVVRRDVPWQETLTALTPLAILINAVKK